MSGGSFNYLFAKDGYDYVTIPRELEEMRDKLASLGYAGDAARETDELLLKMRQVQIMAEVRVKRLQAVWKAIEWWQSCDWSEDEVKEALAAYRAI